MIVHVGNYDSNALDGVSTTIVGQCDALVELGVEIEVWFFISGIDRVEKKVGSNGLIIYSIPRFSNPLLAALALPRSSRIWISERLPEVSLFHLHSVFSPQNNRISQLGVPYVVTPNGGWGQQVLQGRNSIFKCLWIWLFEKSLWKKAKFVQAVSKAEVESLAVLPQISEVIQIPNGVNLPLVVFSDGGLKNPSHWLFLGRLAIEQKGLDTLLKAYARAGDLSSNLPPLVLVGPDFRGGMFKLKELAAELGIDSKVKFTGPLVGREKEQILANAAVFLHPSRWEGLPLSILEALAHGVPCLVSPETGVADWIEDNSCGWSVDGDVDKLADSLVSLAEDPAQIGEKALNTRISVSRDFSWESIAGKLSDAYRDLARVK